MHRTTTGFITNSAAKSSEKCVVKARGEKGSEACWSTSRTLLAENADPRDSQPIAAGRSYETSCGILFIVAILSLSAYTEDNWPRFRGPQATGVSQDDPRLPERWGREDNVLWQTEVPGWGWSCPVVWGDKVFLTTVVSKAEYEKPRKGLYLGKGRSKPPKGLHHWMVYCFDINSGCLS